MGVSIFCLGSKALAALQSLTHHFESIDCVVVAKDVNVENDFSEEIFAWAQAQGVKALERKAYNADLNTSKYHITIGWRWLNPLKDGQKLIVMHDSILPAYRGFNPLVSALINGDREVGVTALFGEEEFDSGDIILQKTVQIVYPIKIAQAIEKVSVLYSELLQEILGLLNTTAELKGTRQPLEGVSFSLWRDEEDYTIDWAQDAVQIKRMVDAVGFPYKGACTTVDGTAYRIRDVDVVEDVVIVNRQPGKVLFKKEGIPVVVCGKGLLMLKEVYDYNDIRQFFENKFRLRFK